MIVSERIFNKQNAVLLHTGVRCKCSKTLQHPQKVPTLFSLESQGLGQMTVNGTAFKKRLATGFENNNFL